MGDLFRKTSLEQAETPEKLDEYIKVTHPGIWSVLIACFAIIVAVAVWLAVGRIPTTMDMKGIIFPGSGVISISAPASGQIQDIRVSTGDTVLPHDVLAVIPQPELLAELQELEAAEQPDEEAIAAKRQEYIDASIVRSQSWGVVLDAKHVYDIVQANEQVVSLARMEEGTNILPADLLCSRGYRTAADDRNGNTGVPFLCVPGRIWLYVRIYRKYRGLSRDGQRY